MRDEDKITLRKALNKYLKTASSGSRSVDDVTWEEILKLVLEAQRKYEEPSVIRTYLLTFSENSTAFISWLQLLPETFPYAAVAFAGLKLMLQAAETLHTVREKVFQTLSEIPYIIANSKCYLEIHGSSPRIQKQNQQLYLAMASIFTHILSWMAKSSGSMFTAIISSIIYSKC